MADNSVYIAGIAPGVLTDELGNLPDWATEDTLVKIEAILRKSSTIQKATLEAIVKTATASSKGNLSPEDFTKLNAELKKLLKNASDQTKEDTKRKNRDKEAEVEGNKENKRSKLRETNYARDSHINALYSLAAAGIASAIMGNIDTFDNLYKSGVNMMGGMAGASNGFEALQQMTILSGVRFTELSKIMEKYSSAVNIYGAGKFVKTMVGASAGLKQFGYTTQEAGDLLGAYLQSQQGYSNISSRTQAETQKDLVAFGSSISMLSLATGVSREKMIQNIDAISHSVTATLLVGQVGKQASGEILKFIGSLKDKNVGEDIAAMMTDTVPALNKTFQTFAKAGMGAFGQEYMQFSKGLRGLDAETQRERLADFGKVHETELRQRMQFLNTQALSGNAEAGAAAAKIQAMLDEAQNYKKLTKEEKDKLAATAESTKALKIAQEKLASTFQALFVPLIPVMNFISGTMDVIATVLTKFSLLGPVIMGVVGALIMLKGGLAAKGVMGNILGAIFGGKGSKGGMLGGKGDGILGSKGDMLGGAGKGAGGLLGGIGGGLTGLGKGLASLGGGIGKGVGGILTGLATGLRALSNPRLLIGVAVLTAMSAAAWVAGQAFQAFQGLDWSSIGKAILGITAVGVAAAILGLPVVAVPVAIGSLVLAGLAGALWLLGAALKNFPSGVMDGLGGMFSEFGSTIGGLVTSIVKPFTLAFNFVSDLLTKVFGGILDIASSVIDMIVVPFKAAGEAISAVFSGIWDVVSTVFGWIKNAVSAAFSGIGKIASMYIDVITAPFKMLWSVVSTVFGAISGAVSSVFGWISGKFSALGDIMSSPFKYISSVVSNVFGGLRDFASNVFGIIGDKISKLLSPVKWLADKITNLFSSSTPDSASKQLGAMADSAGSLQPYADILAVINKSLVDMSMILDSFTGLKTIQALVSSINEINVVKAMALSALGSMVSISLPQQNGASSVASPTAPASTSLDSVSAPDTTNNNDTSSDAEATVPTAPSKSKKPADDGVAGLMAVQNDILNRLLISMDSLTSVNKDILRYTKSNA